MNNQNNGGFCTKCGTPHSADDIFCSKCGNKFANTITPKFAQQAPRDNFGTPQFDDPYGAQPHSQFETAQPQPIHHTSAPSPQPQPVQSQFAQPQPVKPQFAQPQHVSQQPEPQFEYSTGAIARWKTACCILLFVAILAIAILPLFSFASYNYYGSYDDKEQIGVFDILLDEKYSVINALKGANDTSEVPYLFKMIMLFVGTLLFVIFTQIYAINGIIAMCKRDFSGLSILAFKSIKMLILVFMLFSIYTLGGAAYRDDTIIAYGVEMGAGSLLALIISIALILACLFIASAKNKRVFYMDGEPRYIKKVIAFVGLLALCVIALFQHLQPVYTWALNDLFYDFSEGLILIYIPFLILYTTVVIKMTKELTRVGLALVCFTYESQAVLQAKKLKAPSAPNLLANVIFLTLILIVSIIAPSMDYNTYLSFGALISMLAIALGTYIAYAIFNSKENRLIQQTSNL